jgi:hypothetical protein
VPLQQVVAQHTSPHPVSPSEQQMPLLHFCPDGQHASLQIWLEAQHWPTTHNSPAAQHRLLQASRPCGQHSPEAAAASDAQQIFPSTHTRGDGQQVAP